MYMRVFLFILSQSMFVPVLIQHLKFLSASVLFLSSCFVCYSCQLIRIVLCRQNITSKSLYVGLMFVRRGLGFQQYFNYIVAYGFDMRHIMIIVMV